MEKDKFVIDGKNQLIKCKRCGCFSKVVLPQEINAFVDNMNEWANEHKCKPEDLKNGT